MARKSYMTRAEFATYCDVSPQTVTNWMIAGMPCERTGRQGSHVRIEPRRAVPWVINHREPPGSQRERLAGEQADKVAMENEARRGRLIDAGLVEECFMGLRAHLAQALDAIGGRLANELAGIDDPGVIRTKILEETREIRSGVEKYDLRTAEALERIAQDLERGEAAAEQDGEPVGGPEEATPRRKRRTRKVAKQ